MGNPTERFIVKNYHHTAHNLDALLRQLDKEHKTYAEWQKEQYSAFYDVRSTIKIDIDIMHYEYMERAYDRKQRNDLIQVFKKYGYKVKEGEQFE